MALIQVLVVADGLVPPNTAVDGISFAAGQDPTDDTFTVSEFIWLLENNGSVGISVETAHRRQSTGATYQNFNFATADLSKYDVIWMFGYEGNNDGGVVGTAIGDDEVLAITQFMNAGGGVFATGDHSGMGSDMCGRIPRVRTMRKWYGDASDLPSDYPAQARDFSGATVPSVNWPGGSSPSASRADTVQYNPAPAPDPTKDDKPVVNGAGGVFQFEDQSDDIPQTLTIRGAPHPILQGSSGQINRFPDHMHEGEVVTPLSLAQVLQIANNTIVEYPSLNGTQPAPRVIATGDFVKGHGTTVDNTRCTQQNFVTDNRETPQGTIGTVCVYDGRPAGVGRVVTDGSFHHYIDLNLNGDPCAVETSTHNRATGFGAPFTAPTPGGVLADLQQFYVNTVVWLAKPVQTCRLVFDKTTYDKDETSQNSTYPHAGWVQLDGVSANDLGLNPNNLANPPASQIPAFTLTFDPTLSTPQQSSLQAMLHVDVAVTSTQPVIPLTPLTSGNLDQPQTFLYPASVTFSGTSGFDQLGAGVSTQVEASAAVTTVSGVTLGNAVQLVLTSAEDPYFIDVDPSAPTQPPWLSADLRFFKMSVVPDGQASLFKIPIGTDPNDPNTGACAFITAVINQLNTNNAAIGGDAWFTNLPTLEENSKLEFKQQDDSGNYAFNFAVARVEVTTAAAAIAKAVRVFFRLFQAQNTVSNFDTNTTYRFAQDGAQYGRKVPLLGMQNDEHGNGEYVTVPCFAAPRINLNGPANMADQHDDANAFDISSTGSGTAYRYFACWVDLNQPQQAFLPAAPPSNESPDGPWTNEWAIPGGLQSIQSAINAAPHQCLVAEIRFV
jgi:hypothetical protein